MMKNRHSAAETSYAVRSTCGVWRIGLSGDRIARIVLPPSPPSAGRAFKWHGVPEREGSARASGNVSPALNRLMAQTARYFSGKRAHPVVPFAFREGSSFERKVWRRMRLIPFGGTMTYGGLADSIGSPRACRAVGNACAANPLPILIPCHRVVAKGGLGGFSGGLGWKKFLLALEGGIKSQIPPRRRRPPKS